MIGKTLAHYEILEKIGAGGMGEVYRARDSSLGREVALKLLPDAFARDPDRLARFEREAKLLASLSHRNIAVVHGLHHEGEIHFLAMELVSGQDLSQLLSRGRLTTGEALNIALQIAEALEAAHAHGIIHRDLKPANVIVTPEGEAKVLDFGLAKSTDSAGGADSSVLASQSPTLTGGGATPDATVAGTILGTAAYMSPEQARGKPTDSRTDVWAFGCVFYEMLTGHPPFRGETITDCIAAILHADVDLDRLAPDTPAGARHVLRRCLHREREQRLQSMGDARVELSEARAHPERWESRSPAATHGEAAGRGVRARLPILLGAAAVLAVIAFLLGRGLAPDGAAPPPRTFEVPITGLRIEVTPRISPDGRWIAFGRDENIWLRSTYEVNERELAATGAVVEMAWSPDSRSLAYYVEGALWRIDIDRGAPYVVCNLSNSWVRGSGLNWSSDGNILFAQGSSDLCRVPASGGEIEIVLPEVGDEVHFHAPSPLPDNRGLLYSAHALEGDVVLEVLSDAGRRELLRVPGVRLEAPAWSPTGHILFRRETDNPGIWALPFSLDALEVTGPAFRIVANGYFATLDANGSLFQVIGELGVRSHPAWIDMDGRIVERLGTPQRRLSSPQLSPDGTRIVATIVEGSNPDIWIMDLDRGAWSRATFSDLVDSDPVWLPDSRSFLYAHTGHIRQGDLSGSREHPYVAKTQLPTVDASGTWLAGTQAQEGASLNIIAFNLVTGDSMTVLETDAREGQPALSPDARYLAYTSDETGRREVYITTFPEATSRWQVSISGGIWPIWSPNSREVFYRNGGDLMRATLSTSPEVHLSAPERVFTYNPDVEYVTQYHPERNMFLGVAHQMSENTLAHPVRITENWTVNSTANP